MADLPHLLRRAIAASVETFQTLSELEPAVTRAVDAITTCLADGRKLLVCGNGGSAADAAHFATEFVVRFIRDRPKNGGSIAVRLATSEMVSPVRTSRSAASRSSAFMSPNAPTPWQPSRPQEWRPPNGDNGSSSYRGMRLLVMGTSHYCTDRLCPSWTITRSLI